MVEAYAKYFNPQSTGSNIAGFAAALTGAFGLSAASTGEALKAYNSLNSYGSVIASGGGGHTTNGFPKLFVNILLFNKSFNLVDATFQQIDGGFVVLLIHFVPCMKGRIFETLPFPLAF